MSLVFINRIYKRPFPRYSWSPYYTTCSSEIETHDPCSMIILFFTFLMSISHQSWKRGFSTFAFNEPYLGKDLLYCYRGLITCRLTHTRRMAYTYKTYGLHIQDVWLTHTGRALHKPNRTSTYYYLCNSPYQKFYFLMLHSSSMWKSFWK